MKKYHGRVPVDERVMGCDVSLDWYRADEVDADKKKLLNEIDRLNGLCIGHEHEITRFRKALEFYADENRLASIQHRIWSKWMEWMLKNGGKSTQDGWLMDEEKHTRWVRQMTTDYSSLDRDEQQSDIDVINEFHLCNIATAVLKEGEE